MENNRFRWTSQTKLVVSLLLLALAIYLLFRFSIILRPLVLAIILAYVLTPQVNFFQRRLRIYRGVATLLAYLILAVILASLPVVIIPLLGSQIAGLNLDLQILTKNLETILGHTYYLDGQVIDGQALFRQVIASLQGLIQPVFSQTLSLAVDVVTSIIWIIFIAVVSFYLVKDGPVLRKWLEEGMPPGFRPDFIRLRDEINQIWSAFFRGQLVLAMIVAIIFTCASLILGLPFALAMGVLAGVLEFLPSIGHGIWLIIASLLAIFVGSTWLPIPNVAFTLLIIALHLFFQQFDINYLIPRIIGRSVHLPPLVVILGIVSGAALAGILGIPLAAPTIASARVLGRYVYCHLFDLETEVETSVPPLPPPNALWWRIQHPKEPPEIPIEE